MGADTTLPGASGTLDEQTVRARHQYGIPEELSGATWQLIELMDRLGPYGRPSVWLDWPGLLAAAAADVRQAGYCLLWHCPHDAFSPAGAVLRLPPEHARLGIDGLSLLVPGYAGRGERAIPATEVLRIAAAAPGS